MFERFLACWINLDGAGELLVEVFDGLLQGVQHWLVQACKRLAVAAGLSQCTALAHQSCPVGKEFAQRSLAGGGRLPLLQMRMFVADIACQHKRIHPISLATLAYRLGVTACIQRIEDIDTQACGVRCQCQLQVIASGGLQRQHVVWAQRSQQLGNTLGRISKSAYGGLALHRNV